MNGVCDDPRYATQKHFEMNVCTQREARVHAVVQLRLYLATLLVLMLHGTFLVSSNLPVLFAPISFVRLQILYFSRAGMMLPQIVNVLWNPEHESKTSGDIIDAFVEFYPIYSFVTSVRYAIKLFCKKPFLVIKIKQKLVINEL